MAFSFFTITILVLLFLSKRRPAPPVQGGFIAPPVSKTPKETIKVGAYNIHRAKGTDGHKDLNRIADVLSSCDLAGLSELQGGIPFISDNQLLQLGKKLNLASVFACTQQRWGFENRGNGGLSHFPINHWRVTPLLDSVGKHPRCLLKMELQIEDQKVAFFATHLARRIDQESQLKVVLEKISQYEKAILVGDLNLTREFPMLADALKKGDVIDAHQNVDDANTVDKIDWILLRGLTASAAGVINSPASDHPFYWADVVLK